MLASKFLHGRPGHYVNISKTSNQQLHDVGYLYTSANSEHKTAAVKQHLLVINSDNSWYRLEEGQILRSSDQPQAFKLKCYYHIFCNDNPIVLDIVEEQLDYIMSSPIYQLFDSINCCVTGNYAPYYQAVLDKINKINQSTDGRLRVHKAVFGDTSYERFTLYAIRDDPDVISGADNTFIFYLHSKGVTKIGERINEAELMAKWRKCMMHFLLTKGEKCLEALLDKAKQYDTVGILYVPNDGIINKDGPIYGGNFWWTRASYIKRCFDVSPIIDSYYWGPEHFIFTCQPNFCCLYQYWDWWKMDWQFDPKNYLHLYPEV